MAETMKHRRGQQKGAGLESDGATDQQHQSGMEPARIIGWDRENSHSWFPLGSMTQQLEVGWSRASLLWLTPNAQHLPSNTHAGPHPAQPLLKKLSKPTNQQQIVAFSSTLSHQTISPINLIKTLQSPFSSGEFPPLFPQKSLGMYCQECAFAVAFQVA